MTERDKIVEFIRRNRVSTTEVTDALGKSGVVPGLYPLTPDQFRVGRARCVFAAHESNYAVHEQIRDIQEGDVVLVFAHDCQDRAIIGDLISKYVLFYRGAAALVVVGLVRDAARLRRERYPIWTKGVTPLGCFNADNGAFPDNLERDIRNRIENGVAVCDDGGVVVIPSDKLDNDLLDRLKRIELQEDVWYYCLDTLKWDTKMIVCDKEYLRREGVLPDTYCKRLIELRTPFDGCSGAKSHDK